MDLSQVKNLLAHYDIKLKGSLITFFNKVKRLSEDEFIAIIKTTIGFVSKRRLLTRDLEMFIKSEADTKPHSTACKYCYGTGVLVAQRGKRTKEFSCHKCRGCERDLERYDENKAGWYPIY